jgi:hypothetical protein
VDSRANRFKTNAALAVLATGRSLDVQVLPEPLAGLAELPDSHPDWRVNNLALSAAGITAASPLETRQQRRAAAKALARGLATSGRLKERGAQRMARKTARSMASHDRHKRIAEHVPTSSD